MFRSAIWRLRITYSHGRQMRNRHRDMLHKANFLHTTAQPRLVSPCWIDALREAWADLRQFYKPWELRDEEEDIIDEQIRNAKAQIEDELATTDDTAQPSTEANESGMYEQQ